MFLSILAAALKGMFCFTGSYSNNIFPDPLSSEEEEYYIKKYLDNNDKDARNTLIEHNLRLVAHVVKKYEQTRKDTDDFCSHASMPVFHLQFLWHAAIQLIQFVLDVAFVLDLHFVY